MTRFTYQHLIDLVHGDHELVTRLVEEGVIERCAPDRVVVNVEQVLIARTLWRELEIDWSGVEVILRLREQLASARQRIAELEASLATATKPRSS